MLAPGSATLLGRIVKSTLVMPDIRDNSVALRDDVFVSHIVPEKAIALVLQQLVREAFRHELAVFVASDQTSIGGGPEWYAHIMSHLRKATVVLVLVSPPRIR